MGSTSRRLLSVSFEVLSDNSPGDGDELPSIPPPPSLSTEKLPGRRKRIRKTKHARKPSLALSDGIPPLQSVEEGGGFPLPPHPPFPNGGPHTDASLHSSENSSSLSSQMRSVSVSEESIPEGRELLPRHTNGSCFSDLQNGLPDGYCVRVDAAADLATSVMLSGSQFASGHSDIERCCMHPLGYQEPDKFGGTDMIFFRHDCELSASPLPSLEPEASHTGINFIHEEERQGSFQNTLENTESSENGFLLTPIHEEKVLSPDHYSLKKKKENSLIEGEEEDVATLNAPETPTLSSSAPRLQDWQQMLIEQKHTSPEILSTSPFRYFSGEVIRDGASNSMSSVETDKKRQHVYNTMFHVPWRCELLIDVGFFVCLDSFLSLFTVLPIRMMMLARKMFCNRRQFQRPSASEWSDFGCFLVLVSGVMLLQQADISYLYHMIRSQGTIKLYVIYNVLEIFDKLCQSFGSDVLQVLFQSAVGLTTCSQDLLIFEAMRFTLDECIAMSITLSVVIRSHNNALLTLLVSNNFTEIKSSVFKRLNKDNLLKLAYLDTVERFHIIAHLFFVLVQNLLAEDEPWFFIFTLNAGMVLVCEVLVDLIKHAFLAKFNEIKPEAYADFLQALCRQTLSSGSHEVQKTMEFVPLAPACVVIRVLIPLYAAQLPHFLVSWRSLRLVLLCILTYVVLVTMKIVVGLGLQKFSRWYVDRCSRNGKHLHVD